MPTDSNGISTRDNSVRPVDGQLATASQVNVPVDDLYAIVNRLDFLDGRRAWIGNKQANGYRVTGAANAVGQQDYVTKNDLDTAVNSIVNPIFPGFLQVDTVTSTAAPGGWLYANGQEVSRATYPQLWARVSAGNNIAATQGAKTAGQYGPGNGSTSFTLPNLYADGGYFIRPMTSGRGIGTVQADDYKSHNHSGSVTIPPHSHSYLSPNAPATHYNGQVVDTAVKGRSTASTSEAGGGTHSLSIANTGGTETRPKNIAYPVLIKA